MGRSVSCASGSVHIAYARFEQDWGNEEQARWDWECARDDFVADMQSACASLATCDRWLGREDHALLENAYAWIGVSEYGGLVSMWVAPKEAGGHGSARFAALCNRWIGNIESRFYETAHRHFAEPLELVGHMSNGCGVFRRVGVETEPGLAMRLA